jgi:ATP:ADP antiporter, AAA family
MKTSARAGPIRSWSLRYEYMAITAHKPDGRVIVTAATTCAAAVLASQLAGKAARDAIFLQQFPVTNLPLLLAVSSALAIATTFLFARRMSRGVPAKIVQAANLGSAALLIVEWALIDRFPRPVATLIYMHQTLIGPILVSGFWSIISECFDPRTARRVIGTIGTGATVGGLIGAVLAERIAALAGTPALLLAIAGLQLAATWRFGVLARCGTAAVAVDAHDLPPVMDVADRISRVALLRRLAAITVIVTVAAALIDYIFKASVTARVAQPDDLARVFATFHGTVGLLTAIVSWLLGRRALQSWGLARTLATLPGSVFVCGVIGLLAPGFPAFVVLRGAENVARNSLYREAYEVFFTPLAPRDRRATKTVIDVGVERFGDVIGGIAVLVILAVFTDTTHVLLVGAVALSMVGVVVALQSHGSYIEALEHSLHEHAIELGNDEPAARPVRSTLEMIARRARPRAAAPGNGEIQQLADLRSDDVERIRRALAQPLPPAAVAFAIPLLARADVGEATAQALAAVCHRCTGQLVDAMRDPSQPLAARARIPALLASCAPRPGDGDARTAADVTVHSGLLAALHDDSRDVRRYAAEALLQLRERDPELELDQAAVFEGVRRELAAVADPDPSDSKPGPPPDPDPAERSTGAHLATLLALALPAEPVKTAFQGLSSDDVAFRGVALEYLDNVLPDDIRERMWIAFAVEAPALLTRRPVEDVRAELLRSQQRRAAAR